MINDIIYSCAYRTNCLIQFCIMHNSCIQCPHCNPPPSFALLITSLHFILCWKQWWIKCIQCPTPHTSPSCQLHFANNFPAFHTMLKTMVDKMYSMPPHPTPAFPVSFTLLITSLHLTLCWKQRWIKCIQCPTPHSNPSCQLHFSHKLFHLPF